MASEHEASEHAAGFGARWRRKTLAWRGEKRTSGGGLAAMASGDGLAATARTKRGGPGVLMAAGETAGGRFWWAFFFWEKAGIRFRSRTYRPNQDLVVGEVSCASFC